MTIVIQSSRRSGRTSALALAARITPGAIIVCHSAQERDRIVRDHKVPAEQVYSFHQVPNLRGRDPGPVMIDNTELVLRALLGVYPDVCVFEGDA